MLWSVQAVIAAIAGSHQGFADYVGLGNDHIASQSKAPMETADKAARDGGANQEVGAPKNHLDRRTDDGPIVSDLRVLLPAGSRAFLLVAQWPQSV